MSLQCLAACLPGLVCPYRQAGLCTVSRGTNFAEFPFRNCLENSLRRLSAPLWRQEAPELGLLPPLLATLGAPIRDLSRISKQFLQALSENSSSTARCSEDEPMTTWLHERLLRRS